MKNGLFIAATIQTIILVMFIFKITHKEFFDKSTPIPTSPIIVVIGIAVTVIGIFILMKRY